MRSKQSAKMAMDRTNGTHESEGREAQERAKRLDGKRWRW